MSGSNTLVIVESPTKVKSISQYLGDDYTVLASVGHIRDLIEPKNLPPELKKGSLGKFSVDVDNGFEPYYVVSEQKKKTVAELKRALKDADELILATDEDREGEAIAWHLLQVLQPKVPVKRMVFHEITREAIEAAKDRTRDIDVHLVDAQETRRILDRLYGYEVSPVLWRKVGPGLSAGRVQSAATRLIVDRERERLAFVKASYWGVEARFAPEQGKEGSAFVARLTKLDGERVATGRDFDDHGVLKNSSVILGEAEATTLTVQLTAGTVPVTVSSVESKPYTRRPAAPFTTSTLQQEAARKLRFTARQTMSVAQSLYENGYITYMRTDSSSLSSQALNAARTQAAKLYGAETVPASPRLYGSKSKNAQEAHEAVRPAGSTFALPSELRPKLSPNDFKLYDLIWKRTIASQMADAKGQTATVTIDASPVDVSDAQGTVTSRVAEFQASGTVITFRGFLAAYEEGKDEARDDSTTAEAKLPPLTKGQKLDPETADAKSHETSPPPRYTEASLVKTLDELGIGRPSTYASIISTIIDRGYVAPRGSALVPSWTAFSVVRLLEEHFHDLVEYNFTAQMEGDLDRIAAGSEQRNDWLRGFYFGTEDHKGLRGVIDNLGEIDAREINSTPLADGIVLRIGRYGPYLEVAPETEGETPRRVNVPEDLAPDELTAEKAVELVEAPIQTDRVLGVVPETGKRILVKDGRFGPYVTEGPSEAEEAAAEAEAKAKALAEEAEAKAAAAEGRPVKKPRAKKAAAADKPRTASLFKSMIPEQVTYEQAIGLLELPRVVGVDAETGAEITAQNGRYGPYLKKGTDTRSLTSEDEIFTVTLEAAHELFAQPKYGARTTKAAIKEFEADPVSGKPIKIKDGRFGPYVTDGETNVTVSRGANPEDVTFEEAVQMLADKRAKGPVKRKSTAAKKPAAKKPAAKKPAAAKTTATKTTAAKKPATKRAPAKKPAAKASEAATTE